ncbi:hypothetical protein SUGI_0693040 [Cryptomeria japonica]|nr:hypothetical protein SUGI_0693040 [Cryptomeria japonica]
MFEPQYKIRQLPKTVCIYRVPKSLMINKKESHAPFYVSFEPYNHNMNTMDQHKVEAVHRFLARLKIDVTILIAEIGKLDSKIRECYEEVIEWDEETITWMLTMDGCFILEFLRSWIVRRDCFSLVFQDSKHENTVTWDIQMDILKLENQIPLFVLITILCCLEFGTDEGAVEQLTKLLEGRLLFGGYPFNVDFSVNLKEHILKQPYHLLDLYRMVIKDILTHPSPDSAIAVKPDGSCRL